MRRTGTETYTEYRELLETDPAESAALLDALSITVTNFFRNPRMWRELRSLLRSIGDGGRELSIWSAPCADGREPYSLAMMAIDDGQIAHRSLSILGTDINPDAIERARLGRYETTRTADIADELSPLSAIEPHLERSGDTFRVKRPARRLVSFDRHDLIREDPPGTFDLILCRNLLIYIAEEYKEPVFDTLFEALEPGGYLVIGMTETLPRAYRTRFETVDQRTRIYRVR